MSQHAVENRVRRWGEHPLSIPINLSWLGLALFAATLLPIYDAAASAWGAAGMWLAANLALSGYLWTHRNIPLENPRQRDSAGQIRGTSLWQDALRRLKQNQMATLSAGALMLMIVACFGQRFLYAARSADAPPSDPDSFFALHLDYQLQHNDESFAPPSARHWFGTDALGRDLFARTLYGGTVSFLVALVATVVSLVIGVTWGAIAGFFGGRIDHYMMRIVDILYGLPFMFLVILILTLVLGVQTTAGKHREDLARIAELEAQQRNEELADLLEEREIEPGELTTLRTAVWLDDNMNPTYVMFLAIGLVFWLTMARITRGQVLSLREREFVVAARTIGAGDARLIFLHIIPNLLGPVIIYTTLTIPTVILAEAFLSFLGLGISEPDCSWGSLASGGLRDLNVIKPYWWLVTYPALAMFLALFSLNFIGDGLRDALDPKMKR